MKKIMTQIRPDKCMDCNTDRSIELYDSFDRPVNYSYLVDLYEKDKNLNVIEKFDNRQLSYMLCRKCGRKYCIDWRNGNLPIPTRAFWYLQTFLHNNYEK